LILCKDYNRALPAIENVLAVEDNPIAKADTLLDQGRCHLALKDLTKARKSIEECFAQKPQGALEAEASILFGDLCMAEGKPATAKEKYAGVAVLIEDARLKPLAISRLITALDALKEEANAAKYRKELAEKFPNWQDDSI